jgi:hypothetical protein
MHLNFCKLDKIFFHGLPPAFAPLRGASARQSPPTQVKPVQNWNGKVKNTYDELEILA